MTALQKGLNAEVAGGLQLQEDRTLRTQRKSKDNCDCEEHGSTKGTKVHEGREGVRLPDGDSMTGEPIVSVVVPS